MCKTKRKQILVDSITDAVLLNRYLALVHSKIYDSKHGKRRNHIVIEEKRHYKIQWQNINSDLIAFIKNPLGLNTKQFSYRLLGLLYIVFGIFQQSILHKDPIFAFIGAIAFDAAGASTTNGEPTSITYSITIGSGSNRYVIWGVQGYGQTLSATFDGNTATDVINKAGDQKIWGYLAPGSGSKNIVISTGAGGSIMASVAVSFSGVHQTTPTGATNYAENGNPLSISLTTTTNDAMRVDFGVAINDSASDISSSLNAGTFRAQKQNAHNQFRVYICVYTNPQAVAGADTYDWSFTNAGFYQVAYAVEVKAAADATTVKTLPVMNAGL